MFMVSDLQKAFVNKKYAKKCANTNVHTSVLIKGSYGTFFLKIIILCDIIC